MFNNNIETSQSFHGGQHANYQPHYHHHRPQASYQNQYHNQRQVNFAGCGAACAQNLAGLVSIMGSTWRSLPTFDLPSNPSPPPPPPPSSPWPAMLYYPLCLYPSLYSSPNLDQINNWPLSSNQNAPELSSSSSSSLNTTSSSAESGGSSSSSSSCCPSDADESTSGTDDDSMSTFDDDEVAKNVVDSILSQSAVAASVESSSSSSSVNSASALNELKDITNSPSFGLTTMGGGASESVVGNVKPKFVAPRFERKWMQFNSNPVVSSSNGQFGSQPFGNFYPNAAVNPMGGHKKSNHRYPRRGELTTTIKIDHNRVKNNAENNNHDIENNHKPHRRYQHSLMFNQQAATGFNNFNNNKSRFHFQRMNQQLPATGNLASSLKIR